MQSSPATEAAAFSEIRYDRCERGPGETKLLIDRYREQAASADLLGKVRYLPAFDGMRAWCITAVIAFHVVSSDRPWLQNLAKRGWCGVDVFFVLSGFLITWIIAGEIDRSGSVDLTRFYARRALRLQPTFITGLLSVTLLLLVFNHHKFLIVIHEWPFFLTYTYNFAVAFGVIAFTSYGQVWSLCIEEHFYLLWPWVLRRVGTRRSLRIALAIIVGVVIYRSMLYGWLNWGHLAAPSARSLDRIYYGTDTRIDSILVGCAAALALRERALRSLFRWLAGWPSLTTVASIMAVIAVGWATGGAFKGGWRAATVGFTLIAVAAASVILAVFLRPKSMLARFLSWPPMVFVGKISYGIYLFHDFLWDALARLMGLEFGKVGTLPQELTALLLVFFGSIAIAWIHFVMVEKRFLAWRDRMETKRKTRIAATVAIAEPILLRSQA
jgi:peptidoglycan/LPS O-acetylase OafA/YrhL